MSTARPGTPADAIAKLRNMPAFTNLGVTLVVIAPEQNGNLQGYSVPLSEGAAEDLAQIAEASAARLIRSSLLAYGPALLIPPSHAMHVTEAAAGSLVAVQAAATSDDLEVFDPSAAYAEQARMVAARYSSADGVEVVFYRLADTLLQFTKKKYFGLVRRDGQYDRLEPADVLLMRADFDVISINGFAFFYAKQKFERAFGFLDQLQAASAATFDSVTAQLKIEGLQELRGPARASRR